MFGVALTFGVAACGGDEPGGGECSSNADCPSGQQCAQGVCIEGDDVAIDGGPDASGCTDEDGDGFYGSEGCGTDVDCDDTNADVNPDASEICDGLDNDCDGETDETFDDLGDSCSSGIGPCEAEGTYVCNESGDGVTCDAEPGEGSEEVCDMVDNDCDGTVDNVDPNSTNTDVENCGACGNDCTGTFQNATAACEMGGCAIGECDENYRDLDGDPSNGCEYRCEAAAQGKTAPQDNICDGLDNDCDGEIDEDVTGTLNGEQKSPGDSCTSGVGQCATQGTVICAPGSSNGDAGTSDVGVDAGADAGSSGASIVCDATPGNPSPEICDNLDNDCDGTVNENCGCNYNGKSAGVCSNGQTDSQGNCTIAPTDYQNPESGQCDQKDNDCDGVVDEGCTCTFDSDGDGDTSDETGVCTEGTIDSSGNCPQPSNYSSDETTCDSVDNDCDGTVDEGCTCNYKGKSTGVCGSSGTNPDGSCETPPNYESTETSCDGFDNDCDGVVDENCSCNYLGRTTGVCGAGGTIDPNTGNCNPPGDYVSPESSPGQCDRKDNDCDGVVDENCSCVHDPTENDGDTRDSDGSHNNGVCQGQTVDPSTGLCTEPSNFELEEQTCDGLDNDCDGKVDEDCNDDGDDYCDGYMNITSGTSACSNTSTPDCADGTPQSSSSDLDVYAKIFPGAASADSGSECMKDVDGDGRGDASPPTKDQTKGIGDIKAGTDCNDSTADASPDNSGDECDGLDNNCNGTVDEGCDDDGDGFCDASKTVESGATCQTASDGTKDCVDTDADTFPGAAPNDSSTACMTDADDDDWGSTTAPSGGTAGTDCNDSASNGGDVNPGISSESTCDGKNNDCDANTDEDCNDDGDAFCDAGMTIESTTSACSDTSAGDCADGVPGSVASWMDDTFPGAAPNDSSSACMKDADTDDYGDSSPPSKDASNGIYNIQSGSDCDDGDNNVNQGTTETCDGVDNDCDGVIDEQCPCTYDPNQSRDIDTDNSHENAICQNQTISSRDGTCNKPADFESRPEKTCDGIDNDCDGQVDEGCDDDGDGFCDSSFNLTSSATCDTSGDCDDEDADINSGHAEICDDKDNDCDGDIDEGCDNDGDGHCDASKTVVGDPSVCPKSPTGTADDCIDQSSSIDASNVNPSAAPNEPVSGCYEDQDGDGWGDSTAPSAADDGSDCNDNNTDVSPTAAEKENQSAATCYADRDDDGYGDETAPSGGNSGGDCNDSDPNINPDVRETIGDEIDFNCDDAEACFADSDNDGFRTTGTVTSTDLDCDDPGEAEDGEPRGDCVDTDADISPGAAPNESDQTDVCYEDQDGDGWANANPTESDVDAGSDCNDDPTANGGNINPDASEQCTSSTDFDCDGAPQCGDADCDNKQCSQSGSKCAVGSSNNVCIEFFCKDDTDNDRPYQSNGADGADCLDSSCSCQSGTTCEDSGTDDSRTGADIGECVESACGNGADDDNDGATDCADSDCDGDACGNATNASDAQCVSATGSCVERDCSDGKDNDDDGAIDCNDPDCSTAQACAT